MKKSIHALFLFFLMIVFTTSSFAQKWAWANSAGSPTDGVPYAIAVDKAGNSYITGEFQDSIKFGSTTLVANVSGGSGFLMCTDIFIAKYDVNGGLVWAKRAGGPGYDKGFGIAVDATGKVYVTGQFSNTASFGANSVTSSGDYDIFIAKYDANGGNLWVKKCGGSNWDEGNGIAIDKAGNCYITGAYRVSCTFGTASLTSAGGYDAFVAKYDSNGIFIWAKSMGGALEDKGLSITSDAANNCYVTGYYNGTATIGTTQLTSAGNTDIWIAKYDASGNEVWAKSAGGPLEDKGLSISADTIGSTFFTGYFNGSAVFGGGSNMVTLASAGAEDIFVAKYDYKGDITWVKKFGGIYTDKGYGISIDTAGNSYVAGSFFGSSITPVHFDTITTFGPNLSDEAFVAGINRSGYPKWVAHGGDLNSDAALAVAASTLGRCYTTGTFVSSATFGTHILTGVSTSLPSVFIAKVDSSKIVNGIGEDEFGLKGLAIFPNPSDTDVTVQFETTATNEHISLEIYDALGKEVTHKAAISEVKNFRDKKQATIKRKDLPDGLYLVKVIAGNKIYSARLMLIK